MRGIILILSQSQRNPSKSLEKNWSECNRTHVSYSQTGRFFGMGVIKPSFQQLWNLPDFVIWLKISGKGPAIVSEKTLIKSIGMSNGQVLDFLSFRILL